jgi:hypothetical protein
VATGPVPPQAAPASSRAKNSNVIRLGIISAPYE